MTAASRSLATALWRARFASGLLPLSYTTTWDTTQLPNWKACRAFCGSPRSRNGMFPLLPRWSAIQISIKLDAAVWQQGTLQQTGL